MVEIEAVNDANFDEILEKSSQPVLVDFGAEWCHPCKQLDPIVDELAAEWGGKVKVVKLDIDQNPQTTMAWEVMGVPTLMLFVEGEPRARLQGFHPKQKIISKLASHISG